MKIKDITPKQFSCGEGRCPSIYETDRDTILIIGKRIDSAENLPLAKIAPNETLIEIPVDLIRGRTIKEGK